ncbi:uncharacterized protein BO97DRAFT_387551 [Aspergillus homomorphus CBS 101889]|uniref:Amino acid transporter transmembrane domain-containing protein n=1 Tax=Aspergillus homomorphus (strain CBS 101889) TaxID=1450537 RepID=A0A395I272_ASPHC|nr:hypothetical protein BO97DRAFT_387551 [Aspergillus homomorphus CBS 101889]RAL14160.1 hypothetical protein BO97DRAFT_387551 [Aspergillus homomorphus CBS 101889]
MEKKEIEPASNADEYFPDHQVIHAPVRERVYGLDARVDPSVTFEEYVYWAKIERAEEEEANRLYVEERGTLTVGKVIKNRFSKGVHHENKRKQEREAAAQITHGATDDKKDAATVLASSSSLDPEWKTAARALRTASWGTIFYLITTDILGWSSCPFVYASLGFGPATALYVIFGIAAGVSGYILWQVFLKLDSSRYPMLSFGDTYFRVYGPKARHFINVTQSLQQFMTVSVLILGNGTTLAQLANSKLCFIVCMVIVMVVGMCFGMIRSLQRLGWLTNMSVWLNIVSFIVIMVSAAHYPPVYEVVTKSTLIKTIGPIKTFAGAPPTEYQQQGAGFAGQFNGVDSLVYSYGGAMLFIAFLAEMRHPMDFWKGMLIAQLFICIVYVIFGAFVYSFWGQYSASNIYNIVNPYGLQLTGNIISLITSWIACILYFNVGMKTVYIEVCQEVFKMPEITSPKGRWLWYFLGPAYWILAFVVSAAVPNLNGIVSMVGALLILNFTYTFPALLYVGFRCRMDAALPGEGFDPVTGETTRHDSGWKRWARGFKKYWWINVPSLLYFMGGLACSGMGAWAGIEGLISVFGPGGTVATSFGCAVPV